MKKTLIGSGAAIAVLTAGALFGQGMMAASTAAMPAPATTAVAASITSQVQVASDAEAARIAAEQARIAAEAEAARQKAAAEAAEAAAKAAAQPKPATKPSTSTSSGSSRPTVNVSGIADSAYTGSYYDPAFENTRKCIVRKESGGNYGIVGAGKYHGAYQFGIGTSNSAAQKMGRSDLVGVPASRWSRAEQDEAFWVMWNHGAGRGHWPTAAGC